METVKHSNGTAFYVPTEPTEPTGPDDYSKANITFNDNSKMTFAKNKKDGTCYHAIKYNKLNIIKLTHDTTNGEDDMIKNLEKILENGPGKFYMIKVTNPLVVKKHKNALSEKEDEKYAEYRKTGVTCFYSQPIPEEQNVSGGKRRKTKRKNKNKKRKTRRYRN
jgi:hypothetical protein